MERDSIAFRRSGQGRILTHFGFRNLSQDVIYVEESYKSVSVKIVEAASDSLNLFESKLFHVKLIQMYGNLK